ncbi:hypothetical protein PFTANZ_01498 [Plasmodium falciparum Tanzania (2000708)]|uniref:Uncharacterized protein n=2 Tax=Plasmodium falciparum TaxID=5833 RepID=A0A024WBH7_PLAFA|nr:hypothetical protein PFTANZ_01498 [Plasmodium falciparum Tanzania (2000708)]ETW50443.1 hypothetical protein PFMALIP_01459 [Plasmodium falciparum MaliPS096_E11]
MKNMNIIKKHIVYICTKINIVDEDIICDFILLYILNKYNATLYIKKSIIFMKIVCIWNNCKLKKKKTRTKMEYIKNVIVIG